MAERDDFSKSVIEALAKRVSDQCSNPSCGAQTSGPQENPEKVLNVGVAAHITAAARGGPRYDDTLTSEQRSGIGNGIWLCQTCAKLADNDSLRFTVETLRKWKADAERQALEAIGKTVSSVGSRDVGIVIDPEEMEFTGPAFEGIEFDHFAERHVLSIRNTGNKPLYAVWVGIRTDQLKFEDIEVRALSTRDAEFMQIPNGPLVRKDTTCLLMQNNAGDLVLLLGIVRVVPNESYEYQISMKNTPVQRGFLRASLLKVSLDSIPAREWSKTSGAEYAKEYFIPMPLPMSGTIRGYLFFD